MSDGFEKTKTGIPFLEDIEREAAALGDVVSYPRMLELKAQNPRAYFEPAATCAGWWCCAKPRTPEPPFDKYEWTPEDALAVVEQIRAAARDDERAHALEDALWERVLREVRAGHPQAKELADAALETKRIEFARWCA